MHMQKKSYRLALLALFTAIIIMQNFIPLIGYIPIGPLSLTVIQITVIVAAVLCGPKFGGIVGGVWGTITFIRAFVWPTSPLAVYVFTNPLIAILPRILIGVVAGYVYLFLHKKGRKTWLAICIAAVLGSLTNTILVLGQIYLFYRHQAPLLYHIDMQALLPYLLGVIGTNGIPEAILAGVVVPVVTRPLLKRKVN